MPLVTSRSGPHGIIQTAFHGVTTADSPSCPRFKNTNKRCSIFYLCKFSLRFEKPTTLTFSSTSLKKNLEIRLSISKVHTPMRSHRSTEFPTHHVGYLMHRYSFGHTCRLVGHVFHRSAKPRNPTSINFCTHPHALLGVSAVDSHISQPFTTFHSPKALQVPPHAEEPCQCHDVTYI